MRRLRMAGLAALMILPIVLGACGGVGGSGKPQVVASFYPLSYLTAKIARDSAEVNNLVPACTKPHNWEPSARAVANIKGANVFVYNGAGFEAWVPKTLDAAKNDKRVAVEATAGLTLASPPPGAEAGEFTSDPHIWLDPTLAKTIATNIAAGLTKADPDGKATYDRNLADLLGRLDALDGKFKSGLASCQRKEIITSHAAFGYLARRYGLEQIAVEGLSPDSEPTPTRIAEVTKIARERGATTIYFETLVSPRVSETIAKEVGATTLTLDPLEGVQDEKAQNYFTVMEQNLQHLRQGLGCR